MSSPTVVKKRLTARNLQISFDLDPSVKGDKETQLDLVLQEINATLSKALVSRGLAVHYYREDVEYEIENTHQPVQKSARPRRR